MRVPSTGPSVADDAARLFSGPQTLRVTGENRALWVCMLAAPLVIALASLVFHSLSLSEFVLLAVGGMVFVSLGRGRLLGSSIRIHGRQLPAIDALVTSIAARLGVAPPQIFIRDDVFTPIVAVGVGEPYALVLSSQYVEHLREEELAFLIARELAHIAAGHTRITSLLSTSGRENPVVAAVFGAWLRKTEYTADRVGLLCCGRLDDAVGAISIATFHAIGRRVDMRVLGEQRRELDAEPALRMGEWIGGVPYATNRLDALRSFDASPLAAAWRGRLAQQRAQTAAAVPAAATPASVGRGDCAGFWRRAAAFAVDLAIISAIVKTPLGVAVTDHAARASFDDVPAVLRPLIEHAPAITFGAHGLATVILYFVYGALLVGLCGQTLGMMIFELRVVTTGFSRPSLVQSAWRYTLAFGSVLTAIAFLGLFFRVQPHDQLSRTRVILGRRTT